MKRRLHILLLAASTLLSPSASIAADAATSLGKCQTAVASLTAKYVRSVAKTVSGCLGSISASVVEGASLSSAAGANATSCASKLRKLRNSSKPEAQLDAGLLARIASACDPSVNPKLLHTEGDIWTIGSSTLSAAGLTEYCMRAGGPTSISSLADWESCLLVASDCQARQALALRWPRALEYLEALRTTLAGMTATPETSDAVAVLAEIETALEGTTDDNVVELRCAPATGLAATGQTQCDQNNGTFGACPGPEAGQDGEVKAGIPHRFTDNGDGTVTDHVTGLMWTQSSGDLTRNDANQVSSTWGSALHLYRDVPPANPADGSYVYWAWGFAGYYDWRLPNRRELESLVDLSRHDPAIDPVFHHDCTPGCTLEECACTTSSPYWTTTHVENSLDTWAVSFADGSVIRQSRSAALPQRAVRLGTPNFTIPRGKPVLGTINVKYPWKYDCVPITLNGADLDGRCGRGGRILSFPEHGFLTAFISGSEVPLVSPIDSDGCPTGGENVVPPGADFEMLSGFAYWYQATFCYVSFTPNFTGTDSFEWQMVDWEGNVSEPGLVTITIFEN